MDERIGKPELASIPGCAFEVRMTTAFRKRVQIDLPHANCGKANSDFCKKRNCCKSGESEFRQMETRVGSLK